VHDTKESGGPKLTLGAVHDLSGGNLLTLKKDSDNDTVRSGMQSITEGTEESLVDSLAGSQNIILGEIPPQETASNAAQLRLTSTGFYQKSNFRRGAAQHVSIMHKSDLEPQFSKSQVLTSSELDHADDDAGDAERGESSSMAAEDSISGAYRDRSRKIEYEG